MVRGEGYQIARCQGTGCTSFTQITTTGAGATTFTDTGLTRNTGYTYRVRAVNTAGTSAYSATAAVKTPRT
ncbi:fibronectin type III domain-containing protein [Dactylosporangium matsuzakiense]|uniref:fibronectin type III domain-containing protein n=1 Tax=Dactylosporangium matsuzakiense TaxID=53360 RepID=UPI0022F2A7DA|nr:fibronectin type III domain-containing protein [Dactylosporangium matsuzakiense]